MSYLETGPLILFFCGCQAQGCGTGIEFSNILYTENVDFFQVPSDDSSTV